MANPNSKSAKKSSMFAGIDFGDEPSLSNTSETNNNKEDKKTNPITLNTNEGKEVKIEIQKNIETANNSDKKLNKKQRKLYHEDYYLLYGGKDMSSSIKAKELLDFLKASGYGNSSLKQARESKNIAQIIADSFVPNKKNTRYCDFCGDEISCIEYETLKDGRYRCMTCARTAIKSTDEFREIFDEVKRNMEYFYGININADIKIEVLGPKEINKKAKKSFLHIKTIDKVVKVATVKNKNGYTLLFENGMPRLQTMLKIVCELTHVWQDLNWNYKNISKKYGVLTDEVYYGMSKWAEIQYAFLINEPVVANKEEIITLSLNSARSKGYRRYKANYPITEETVLFGPTPFIDRDYPLSFDYCGEIVEDNDKQEDQINNTKESE